MCWRLLRPVLPLSYLWGAPNSCSAAAIPVAHGLSSPKGRSRLGRCFHKTFLVALSHPMLSSLTFSRVLPRWSKRQWTRNLGPPGMWWLGKVLALRSLMRWRTCCTCSLVAAWLYASGSAPNPWLGPRLVEYKRFLPALDKFCMIWRWGFIFNT